MRCAWLAVLVVSIHTAAAADTKLLLRRSWTLQSSAEVRETGGALSMAGFRPPKAWHPATLPTTVFSALVAEGVYPDPYFGTNLRSAPGVAYNIGVNFSNVAMPEDSPFRKSWWFRTEFQIPATERGKTLWLNFDGINYRANVWLNGKQLATSMQLAGAWRMFQLDVTAAAKPGAANALAIEIFPPEPGDLAITFVDWNPMPPDKGMGLWRDVSLTSTGPVAIRYPFVTTHLTNGAQLTVRAELVNASDRAVQGTFKGTIEKREFSQAVQLAARETKVIHFAPLAIESPRLWWPAQVGPQNLYPLGLTFEIAGKVSDTSYSDFGIREITSELDALGHRLFRINGKNILIRGAGYTFDMLLRSTPERQEAELRYVRDMNLNAVRLEGKLEDEHFFELCDRMGIMVLAGWCCCDHWEKWNAWDTEDETVATQSLRDQLRRLARHPSVKFAGFAITYGDYFRAIGIPLIEGRYFTQDDRSDTLPVMIVNQSMARHAWPGQSPLGKRMHAGNPKKGLPWATVVGMVADTTLGARDEPSIEQWYAPMQQPAILYGTEPSGNLGGGGGGYITLRSALPPEQMIHVLRSTVAEIDPLLPLQRVQTMDDVISNVEAPRRFNTTLITTFAIGALLLALTGIYAVVALSVSLRTREIAIRMALGAQRANIAGLVLVSGVRLALLGCGLGVLGSFTVSSLIRSLLFEVSPTNSLIYMGSVLLMLLVALAASALPVRRAARVDPMVALRYE